MERKKFDENRNCGKYWALKNVAKKSTENFTPIYGAREKLKKRKEFVLSKYQSI